MTLSLPAPLPGTVLALADVPDPAFAAEILGPGLAIEPGSGAIVSVVAPCSGRVVKVHPHAVALESAAAGKAEPVGVLVHLGIDTVSLHGEGFEVLVADGVQIEAGQELIRWDVDLTRSRGLSAATPVVAFTQEGLTVTRLVEPGSTVATGAPLLLVD